METALIMAIKKVLIDMLDKEKRKKYFNAICITIAIFIVFMSFLTYIIQSPLSMFVLSSDEKEVILNLKNNYAYQITGEEYIDTSLVTGDISYIEGGIEVVYYNQGDSAYIPYKYGTDTIRGSGCGPTSLAIVQSTYFPNNMKNPVDMCNWSVRNGFWAEHSGSYHSIVKGYGDDFGINVKSISYDDSQTIIDELTKGNLIVVLMGKGHFTGAGHFMVLRGVDENGKIIIADPASYKRTDKTWDLGLILNEVKKGAGGGGPIWSMENPNPPVKTEGGE